MLTARDIIQPGLYWYFDPIGAPAQIVEVARANPCRGTLLAPPFPMDFHEVSSKLWCARHAVEVARKNLDDALETLRQAQLQREAYRAMLESITPREKEARLNK
jgi:hypothetical protein